MENRFSTICQDRKGWYSSQCPLIIEAYALLKDNANGKVLAQVKVRNTARTEIIAYKLSINAYEIDGREVSGVKDYSILDIKLAYGQEVGARVPIYLPEDSTRTISVSISEVIYNDKNIWRDDNSTWKEIPGPISINSRFDKDLSVQYGIEVGEPCDFFPERIDGFFKCTCGAFFSAGAKQCYRCGKNLDKTISASDIDFLKKRIAERKIVENKNKKKIRNIFTGIAVIVVLFFAVYIIKNLVVPEIIYRKAIELCNMQRYVEAKEQFVRIEEYKDSESQAEMMDYLFAKMCEDNGEYEKAKDIYISIPEVEDSERRYSICDCKEYLDLINAGYMALRKEEQFSFLDDKDIEYGTNEEAYKYIIVDGIEEGKTLELYIVFVDDNTIIHAGSKVFSSIDRFYRYDTPIKGIDSQMYIFADYDDYYEVKIENAVLSESIKFSDTVTVSEGEESEIAEKINVIAGFYTNYPDFDSLVTTYTRITNEGIKPMVYVEGLSGDESIVLYALLKMSDADGDYYFSEKEIEYTAEKPYAGGAFISSRWNTIYHCDATLYVFSDYNAFLDHDFDKAIAVGSIDCVD